MDLQVEAQLKMLLTTASAAGCVSDTRGTNDLVDFNSIEREGLQIGQRRPACAEIVEREAHADLFNAARSLLRLLNLPVSGSPSTQAPRIRVLPRFAQGLSHGIGKTALGELLRRHVHRYANRWNSHRLPIHV